MKINILRKKYSDKLVLKNIEIALLENGLYGFFGKNGQGKTTFFNCLLGLASYEGSIKLDDNYLKSSDCAWIPTEPDFYEYLTVKEFIDFYAMTVGGEKTKNYNALFEVPLNQLIKECSTGTRKKVYINAVLQLSDYKIYIFDEPFNGLDIEANYVLIEEIKKLSKTHIVFISSHIIEVILPFIDKCFYVNQLKIQEIPHNELIDEFRK